MVSPSSLCTRNVCGKLTFVSASINLALWRDRCNIVLRGVGRPEDVVLASVRTEVRHVCKGRRSAGGGVHLFRCRHGEVNL